MHHQFPLNRKAKERLSQSVSRFPAHTILVVGDMMLDVYVWGNVRRISPEAPVPVVEVREETYLLGGTANVVHNVAALGAGTIVAGVLGDDPAGRKLVELLDQAAVGTDGLFVQSGRPTTVKTRVIAQNQQVVRFDREMPTPVEGEFTDSVLAYVEKNLARVDAIIISDYAKGMITRGFMDSLRALNGHAGLPIIVDPKVQHAGMYRDVTMVTPNHHEASRMTGIEIVDESSLTLAGRALLESLGCKTVLITRGKEGMTLFHRDGQVVHIPTVARRVFDVTGAGDTVIAAITLGVVSGLTVEEAALMANLAAGIVVGEVGTAVVSAERLLAAIEDECRPA